MFGVLSVSIGSGPKRERFRWQLAALMLCAGFVLSLSTLIFKAFAIKEEFWATDVLDVRGRGAVRHRLSVHRPLSPAVPAICCASTAGR